MIAPALCLNLWIKPACEGLARAVGDTRLDTPAAHALLLRTAATESAGFRYRRQIRGPARGYPQLEPATLADIGRYLKARGGAWAVLHRAMVWQGDGRHLAARCEIDHFLAFMACRLKYWMIPAKLPIAGDIQGQAEYWKQYYNTRRGRGTVGKFLADRECYLAALERQLGWIG